MTSTKLRRNQLFLTDSQIMTEDEIRANTLTLLLLDNIQVTAISGFNVILNTDILQRDLQELISVGDDLLIDTFTGPFRITSILSPNEVSVDRFVGPPQTSLSLDAQIYSAPGSSQVGLSDRTPHYTGVRLDDALLDLHQAVPLRPETFVGPGSFSAVFGRMYLVDPTAGPVTVVLPNPLDHPGGTIHVINRTNSTNPIYINPFDQETIDEEDNYIMIVPKEVAVLQSVQMSWRRV
jgi:hypothetical protein